MVIVAATVFDTLKKKKTKKYRIYYEICYPTRARVETCQKSGQLYQWMLKDYLVQICLLNCLMLNVVCCECLKIFTIELK